MTTLKGYSCEKGSMKLTLSMWKDTQLAAHYVVLLFSYPLIKFWLLSGYFLATL